MSGEEAAAFGRAWIEAWNAHDLERILSHYAEGIEFRSPFVVAITGAADGRIVGKERLRAYFAEALKRYPDLSFTLERALAGVRSATLCYRSVKNLHAAEVFVFDADGKVERVDCHYAS